MQILILNSCTKNVSLLCGFLPLQNFKCGVLHTLILKANWKPHFKQNITVKGSIHECIFVPCIFLKWYNRQALLKVVTSIFWSQYLHETPIMVGLDPQSFLSNILMIFIQISCIWPFPLKWAEKSDKQHKNEKKKNLENILLKFISHSIH